MPGEAPPLETHGPNGPGAGDAGGHRPWEETVAHYAQPLRRVVDVLVVGACIAFVFLQLGPREIFLNVTPAGGDMGAHVWGPAYLRDELLPNLQVSGWSPDWYAGFAAFQFYMVVPALLIVVLNVGVVDLSGPLGYLAPFLVAGWLAVTVGVWRDRRWRTVALLAGVAVPVLVSIPYGVAFKLVVVSGPLSMPLAAYVFGRLTRAPFPAPAFMAAGSLLFLFYPGFTIYGGNLASTLAGEFAFSISLSLSLVYLGVVWRGLETGRYRAWAAVLLALTGLCHIIPAFWALATTAAIVLLRLRLTEVSRRLCAVLVGAGGAVALVGATAASGWWGLPERLNLPVTVSSVGWVLVAVGVAIFAVGAWLGSDSVRWLTPVGVVAGLLSAFWVLPFAARSAFVNDMGWEKLGVRPDEGFWDRWGEFLLPTNVEGEDWQDLRWVFGLAVVGLVLSLVLRARVGVLLAAMATVTGWAFVWMPQGRLWNGRILPFYYLAVILLATMAVGLLARMFAEVAASTARSPYRLQPGPAHGYPAQPAHAQVSAPVTRRAYMVLLSGVAAIGGVASVLLIVGLPYGVVAGSDQYFETNPETGVREVAGYEWPRGSPWTVRAPRPVAVHVPSWATWNFRGYEGKPAYLEYWDVVTTMDEVGDQHGCGRALWEYDKDTDAYGTPMALMLLPHWTDGCIGSMEGLFFESSMTTPFHFLMQTELSESPSSAQRYMPYAGFDFDLGVQQMQLMGVRYYMATSLQARTAAAGHSDLQLVAGSGPHDGYHQVDDELVVVPGRTWEVYEVAGSELVTPLSFEPAVLAGVGHGAHDWLENPQAYRSGADWLTADEWRERYNADPVGDPNFAGPSVRWFLDPTRWDVLWAQGGPQEWPRFELGEEPEARPVAPAEVADIEVERDRITFTVDQVGTPVLVKASYFPNWEARGADGPWRVAPNLMVVVPTDTQVELVYGRTSVEWLGYGATALGLVAVVGLVLLGRQRFDRTTAIRWLPRQPVVDDSDDSDDSDDDQDVPDAVEGNGADPDENTPVPAPIAPSPSTSSSVAEEDVGPPWRAPG